MPHSRVTHRHRLTVQSDLLPQPSSHSRLRIRKPNTLGPNSTLPTPQPSLPIPQRDPVWTPWQIIPGAPFRIPHLPGPSIAAAALIPLGSTPFETEPQPRGQIAAREPEHGRQGHPETDGDGPDHLPGHTTFGLSFGKGFGEDWRVALQTVNLTNKRFLLDSANTFGGTHFAEPRQIYVELRYRFHY